VRLDPMLDENGRILPALLVPRYPRPADLAPSQPWYDGSQLQFLKQYEQPEPFRYGLSTLALAYNDYKKAQLLQTLWHQHHIQTGGTVVDARPAITLKDWAKDEWERGRRFELGMWDRFVPESTDPIALERPTADVAFSTPTTGRFDRDGALYSYGLAARLFHDALGEYRQHIEAYKPSQPSISFTLTMSPAASSSCGPITIIWRRPTRRARNERGCCNRPRMNIAPPWCTLRSRF
jgi:hypothetical protein